MSTLDEMDETDFLLLQEKVDELTWLLRRERLDQVGLPSIFGGGEDELDAVETGDVLGATAIAVGRGKQKLIAAEGIALGGDPITFQLTGEYAGMLGETHEIFVRVKPVKRGNKNG